MPERLRSIGQRVASEVLGQGLSPKELAFRIDQAIKSAIETEVLKRQKAWDDGWLARADNFDRNANPHVRRRSR